MRAPGGEFAVYPSVESTQDVALERLEIGEKPGVVFAHHQSVGRGRFKREWHSQSGESLTMSLLFHDYADHREPWLLGMAVAVAAAGVIHAQLQWPNDLVLAGKKVGGVLTDLMSLPNGQKIPVIGVGINLNQLEFPEEIAHRATSVSMETGRERQPIFVARQIVESIESLPEPTSWEALDPVWRMFDTTPGKEYKLHDGTVALALGIGPNGQLIASQDGETVSVMAAEAIFGPVGG